MEYREYRNNFSEIVSEYTDDEGRIHIDGYFKGEEDGVNIAIVDRFCNVERGRYFLGDMFSDQIQKAIFEAQTRQI